MTPSTNDVDVIVVGAGLAGLRCAQVLLTQGLSVRLFEASDYVGGRLHSFNVDGYIIDQGFQLINPAYPELARTGVNTSFDYRPLDSSVAYYDANTSFSLGDPRHHPLAALRGLAKSPLGIGDARRFAALLTGSFLTPASRLVSKPDSTTWAGLQALGFSQQSLEDVLQPFLRGTLLSDELEPSFTFTKLLLKSFVKGRPSTHPDGIQALPEALATRLSGVELHLSSPVTSVSATSVVSDGLTFRARHVVLATDAAATHDLLTSPTTSFRSQTTLWWSLPKLAASSNLRIDLRDRTAASALDLSSVAPERSPRGRSLVASPVVGSGVSTDLVQRVRRSVATLYDVATSDVQLITTTEVPHALPVVPTPLRVARETVRNGIYVAGDWTETPSIQGALVSGRRAALNVLRARRSR